MMKRLFDGVFVGFVLSALCLILSSAINAQDDSNGETYIPPFEEPLSCVKPPDTSYTPPAVTDRDCCDIAQDLISMNDAFDICEDELDLLYEAQEMVQTGIDDMLLIEPQTPEIQAAATADGENLVFIMTEILNREDEQAARIDAIIALNQQLLTCF